MVVPLLAASLGIDGGAIFQILAIEDLGLGPRAIGIAFGLGVLSLPIQIYASRIPIQLARRNVQLFLVFAALQAWVLAVLVGIGATGGVATLALGVTVIAEISLSVLFATAWQPLLAVGVDTHGRQRLSSRWRAMAGAVLGGSFVLFAELGSGPRSLFLVLVGVLAIAAAVGLNAVDPPSPEPSSGSSVETSTDDTKKPVPLASATRVVFVVFGVVNVGAMPLWLVYLNEVLWPTVNLGMIAAIQTVASITALLAWKSTDGDVTRRALGAAVINLVGAASIVTLDGPIESDVQQIVVVAATVAMGGGVTVARLALLEATHRVITSANTVRAFTLLDVVASTSLQVGLLLSGFLIAASESSEMSLADPYRAFVLVAATLAIPAIVWFKKTSERDARTNQ